MTFPLLFTVGLHTYSAGSDDGYGNTLPVYNPPKDQAGTLYPVAGWAVPASEEISGDKDRIIIHLQLFAPQSFPATPYSLIDVDGVQYEAIGQAQDYNRGPWWTPHMTVWNLRKVSG